MAYEVSALPSIHDPSIHLLRHLTPSLTVSLRNVLTVILHAVPPPKLISLRALEKATQAELARARYVRRE